jgi:CDP-glycerol glycerophosphotransferase
MPAPNVAPLRALARRVRTAAQYERVALARRAPIDEHAVLYESFAGNGMLCNPEALFRSLLAAPDMGHLRHIWSLSDLEAYPETIAEFAGDPRVSFVKHDSAAYYAALATSKYLINNATFPPQFGKRDGQIYLNTWHGTPLKAMGYDVPGGAVDTRNVARNFLNADYLLAPNDDTAQMYLSAFRMANIFNGRIIEEGSPRIDKQFVSDTERADVRKRLVHRGLRVDDAHKIVLYAPTWKGSFYAPTNDIRQLRATVDAISARIDTETYRVVLKVHQQVYKYAVANKDLKDILVPNDIPANDALAVADVLITDYSSIFIDFLATGRPVLFYTPDLDNYTDSRGLYLPVEKFPGPVCRDVAELADCLKRVNSGDEDDPVVAYAGVYESARRRYCDLERGDAAARIVDVVFRGATEGHRIRQDFADGRESILIHLGGMLSNGITSSALCLLNNIDHRRFDVSVTYQHTTSPSRLQLIAQIHPKVRLLPRIAGMNGSKVRVTPLVAVRRRSGAQHERAMARNTDLLRDEWIRCFGNSRFDYVVDFSGYAPLWPKVFSQRGAGSLSIWLHNDMSAEESNTGRSSYLRASVRGMSGLYRHADHLVSVSPSLADVNREKLRDLAPPEIFSYARNTLNARRVLHLAYGLTTTEVRSLDPTKLPAAPPESRQEVPAYLGDLRTDVEHLVDRHGLNDVRDEVERRTTIERVLPPAPGVRTFVTAGRLSAEKNHERLIKAFDLVHQANPDTRLVILGSGALRQRLTDLADELGLTAAVTLAGHLANPYSVLSQCDCFVLSSDYEGQPMVLLEALTLGLPVVSTAFGSVEGALPEGYGRVVKCSVDALAEGMSAFLRGEVPAKPFDHEAYNRAAVDEFYRAIGAN